MPEVKLRSAPERPSRSSDAGRTFGSGDVTAFDTLDSRAELSYCHMTLC